jgi:uncharacterized membrane protein
MNKGRLEAFSDGVIAILITIMVLELHVPSGADWSALRPLLPIGLAYLLSFVFVGIYWNNHHHLLHTVERVSAGILWANMNLLFWLSLIPFATGWMGQHHDDAAPTAAYGVVMIASGFSYYFLERAIIRAHGPESKLAVAVGNERKEWVSTAIYALAIVLGFVEPLVSDACFVTVAAIWLVPDRRIEHALAPQGGGSLDV